MTACGPAQPKAAGTNATPAAQQSTAAPQTPVELVQGSLDKTIAAKTSKIDVLITVGAPGTKEKTAGSGVVEFGTPASDLTLTAPKRHEISVGSDSYEQKSGRAWKKLSPDDVGAGQGDQLDMLHFLQIASDQVKTTGKTTIKGIAVTGYTASVNLDTAVAGADPADKPNMENIRKSLGKPELPVQVWLDEQGRIVHFEMALPLTYQGVKVTTDTTLTLYDFGAPAQIAAPKV
ncbi:hypothetical protein [Fodinicola feengrottensis]|nr:hypothetical protein [Fodinicola feengrottensis]